MRSIHASTVMSRIAGAVRLIAFTGLQPTDAVRLEMRDQSAVRTPAEPAVFNVHVIREMEHVGSPFTQGLEFTPDGSLLIETSGSYPIGTQSFVRALSPSTGEVHFRTTAGLEGDRFIEGITQLEVASESHWFASTFTDGVAIEYDSELNKVGEHEFPFNGWGLTRNVDSTAFFATNGSEHVMELTPGSFEPASVKTATCLGTEVFEINELEMVDDFLGRGPALLGNLYPSRIVIVLDPVSMRCTGAFHLGGLGKEESNENLGLHVANGIAFNRRTGNFIVTGKNWDQIFEIRLEEAAIDGRGQTLELLAHHLGTSRDISSA